jgi:hypothetical protein
MSSEEMHAGTGRAQWKLALSDIGAGGSAGEAGRPHSRCSKMERAMHDVSTAVAIEFVEHSKRLRAAHYRAEADRFKAMAETESVRSVRRHLQVLAREYEQMASSVAAPAKR